MSPEEIKYICNTLRQSTVEWKGRTECINRGRRKRLVGKTKKGHDKFLWENDCEMCKKYFDLKDNPFEVDHIVEVGPFLGCWNIWINKLFCGQDNLMRLCFSCHRIKTTKGNASMRFKRKNLDSLF